MAGKKRKPEGYQGALDSIYKAVFSSADPGKRKPMKLKGVNATDEFTKGVMTMLENPMLAPTEQKAKIFENTFGDLDLLKFQLDTVDVPGYDGNAGRIRVKIKDLPKFLSNPSAFVDNAYKKMTAQRKAMSIIGPLGIRRAINSANLAMFASSVGLDAKEAMMLGISSGFPDPNPQTQAMALRSIAEIAALKASGSTADLAKAKKLADDVERILVKETDSNSFFSTKSVSGGKPDISADDLKKSNLTAGTHSTYYNQPVGAFLASSKGAGGANEIKAYLERNSSVAMKELLNKSASGAKLSFDERNLLKAYELDFQKLVKTNDKILSQLEKEGYNINDPQIQGFLKSFNQEVHNVDKTALFKDGFGRVTKDGLVQLQFELNKSKYEQTGDKKYLVAQNAIGTVQSMVFSGSKAAYANLSKDANEFRRNISLHYGGDTSNLPANLKSSLRDLENALSKLEKEVNRPGPLNNAPRYRDAIIGGFDGDENGQPSQMTNRAYMSVSNSMKKLLNAQADYYENLGDLASASSFRARANRVTLTPGFDANVMLGRIQFLKGAWDAGVKDGGFFPALLNGSLWDSDFSPSKRVEGLKYHFFVRDENNRLKIEKAEAGNIIMPRDDLPIYAELTGLYYMTPTAIMKTFLWNGEAFGYGASMSHRGMLKFASNFLKNDKDLRRLLTGNDYQEFTSWFKGGNFQEESIKDPEKLAKLIEFLETRGGKYQKLIEGINGYSKWIKKFNSLYERFKRPADLWNGWMSKAQAYLKAPIAKMLQSFLAKNSKWQTIVEKWAGGKIGLYQIVELGVQAAVKWFLAAAGVTLSATGIGVVVAIISGFVVDIIMKIAKPFIDLTMWGVRGLIVMILAFIVFIILILNVDSAGRHTLPSYAVPPNPRLGFLPASQDMYPVDPGFGEPIIIPGQMCPISGIYHCGAGVKWHANNSTRTPAIDVTSTSKDWVAPMSGSIIDIIDQSYCPIGCTIEGVSYQSGLPYGGTVRFQADDGTIYRLIHVRAVLPKGKYQKGTVIAKVYTQAELPKSCCWTGEHWHLDVISGGKWVDANKWYTGLSCTIPACYGD
jgi:hypothetical protein